MAAEAIGSPGQESLFKQLAEYNWEKDKEYQGGLSAILGPLPSPSQVYDLTLRAQCYYMSRKKGTSIDFDGYKTYLSSQSGSLGPARIQTTGSSPKPPLEIELPSTISSKDTATQLQDLSISSTTPPSIMSSSQDQDPTPVSQPQTYYNPPLKGSWQHPTYNPSPTLFSSRPPPPALTSHDLLPPSTTNIQPQSTPILTNYADPSTAPYPTSFAEIVNLIQSGEPIPGIKDIPTTVLWGQGGEQTVRVRRKPWEMHLTEEEVQVGYEKQFGDRRDEYVAQEFPEDDKESGGEGRMPPPKPVPDWRGLKKVEERVPSWQMGAAGKEEGEKK